jgi:hypothetical protein
MKSFPAITEPRWLTDLIHKLDMNCIAIIGPDDKTVARIQVAVIGPHALPDFFHCEDAAGRQLTIHRQKLKPLDCAQTKTPGLPLPGVRGCRVSARIQSQPL